MANQLTYWLRKIDPSVVQPKPSAFVRVLPAAAGENHPGDRFELRIRQTLSLHWRGKVDPGYIRQLMQALSE